MGILEAATQRMKMEEARYEEQIAALKAENERLLKERENLVPISEDRKSVFIDGFGLLPIDYTDEAAERALAERAGGVKATSEETLAQEFSRLIREYHEPDTDGTQGEAWNLIADFAVENADTILSALTTEPAAPEGRQEPMPRNVIWFGFDENTGEFTGEYCSVKPADARGMRPYIPYTARPAEQAVTEEQRGAIAYALTKRLVIDMPTARAAVDEALKAAMEAR